MSEINVVMNKHLGVDQLVFDLEHGKKDFTRLAAKVIAKALVEQACLTTQTEYDIVRNAYRTHVSVLVGNKQRILP
jgi:hypothetical protein